MVELHVSLKTENAYLSIEGSMLFLLPKNITHNQIFCSGLFFLLAPMD